VAVATFDLGSAVRMHSLVAAEIAELQSQSKFYMATDIFS